jgi:hypothetical protein
MYLNRRQWIIGTVAVLAGPACKVHAEDQARKSDSGPALTPAQIREDLAFLKTNWARLDKSFTSERRDVFDRVISDAIAKADTSSFQDLTLDVMRAVAIPRNAHSVPLVGRFLDALPIRTWWFSDGLYVLSTDPTSTDLLGARVEKFGPLTADEALTHVAPYISGTDQRIRYLSASLLTSPMVLRRIGAAPPTGDIPLTFRLRNGQTHSIGLRTADKPDPGNLRELFAHGWSVLIPDEKDLPDRWSHILDGIDDRSPAYAKPSIFSTQWIGDEGKILYIRSTAILSDGKNNLRDDLLDGVLQKRIVPKQPRFVVVDLRLNNGGNFFETMLFTQALPKLMPRDGRIFVLVSRATLSAALVTAAMLKRAGPNNVTLMGEHMGDEGRFWAETQTVTLPNSKIPVLYATKLEDLERGCPDLGECYWPATAFAHGTVSIEPEVKIDVSFADYAAGRDPVLDAALARAK